jgi:hypothetical protein
LNGTHQYTLFGAVSGSLGNGYATVGATTQLVVTTGKGYFSGSANLSSGDTNIVVPEPGTLSLFGTGLVGLAGVIRRKLSLA